MPWTPWMAKWPQLIPCRRRRSVKPSSVSKVPRKKQRMDVSKSKGKSGSMLYVRGIFTERFTTSDRLYLAKDLEAVAKGLTAEKSATLVKRSKMGSGCKDEMQKVCEKLAKVADIQSNPFGETRLLVLKPQKKQVLDSCSTNANIGVLVSSQALQLTVAGESMQLPAGQALGVDFCLEVTIEADVAATVLFGQDRP